MIFETIKDAIPVPCKEGIIFIVAGAFITFVLYFAGLERLGLLMFVLTIWCFYFFRDPDRITPEQPGLIISPADGVVSLIVDAFPPADLDIWE